MADTSPSPGHVPVRRLETLSDCISILGTNQAIMRKSSSFRKTIRTSFVGTINSSFEMSASLDSKSQPHASFQKPPTTSVQGVFTSMQVAVISTMSKANHKMMHNAHPLWIRPAPPVMTRFFKPWKVQASLLAERLARPEKVLNIATQYHDLAATTSKMESCQSGFIFCPRCQAGVKHCKSLQSKTYQPQYNKTY